MADGSQWEQPQQEHRASSIRFGVAAVFLGSLKAQPFLQARSEGRSVGGEATAVQIRIN